MWSLETARGFRIVGVVEWSCGTLAVGCTAVIVRTKRHGDTGVFVTPTESPWPWLCSGTVIVKQPLFQNVPNEKQTAEPPMTTKDCPVSTVVIPLSNGRGWIESCMGNREVAVQLRKSRTHISFSRLIIWSFKTPPRRYILPWWWMTLAPKRAIVAAYFGLVTVKVIVGA